MIERIKSFAGMKHGWLGPGSLAPSELTIDNAVTLARRYDSKGIFWTTAPTGNGGIIFVRDTEVQGETWEHNIEVMNDKVVCSGFSITGSEEYEVNYDFQDLIGGL